MGEEFQKKKEQSCACVALSCRFIMEFEFRKAGTSKNKGNAVGKDSQLEACLGSENFDVRQFVKDIAQSYDTAQEWNQHKRRVQALADRSSVLIYVCVEWYLLSPEKED